MASAISKRQQARNERQLQDLIHTVPGNDRCADCAVKNPGWASWSLGIFLCVRCASLHRKLGVHVSKVKSLSMDSWSREQVENMKKMGNVRSNAKFNPRGVRPDIPIDADMVDSAMEKFIRQKYELRTLSDGVGVGAAAAMPAARQNTGSMGTESWSEEPPPLPPKPGKRFGFNLRTASSTFHRQKHDRSTPPLSPTFSGSDRSARDDQPSPHKNKPSQVFGMKITSIGNNFDTKLLTLRDMGFKDNGKNTDILRSTNGNVDRAVEILIRLGESGKSASRGPAPAPRSITPVSMSNSGFNGISIDKTRQPEQKASSNPWEVKEEAPEPVTQTAVPPRSQSAGPVAHSWNPFLQPQQQSQQQNLESSFKNLQLSQTGPHLQQQQSVQHPPSVPQIPQQYQSNSWQPQPQTQLFSDPWQSQSQQQQSSQSFTMDPAFSQPQQFQQQPQPAAVPFGQSSNPFLRTSRSQTFAPSNPWMSQSQSPAPMMQQPDPWTSQSQAPASVQQASNPFGAPSSAPWQQYPAFQQPATSSPAPMSGQQEYLSQQQQQMQQPTGSSHPFGAVQNPWQQQQTGMPPSQQQQYQRQPQFSHLYSQQQPVRHDKSSILALYNMPQLAPARPLHTLQEDSSASNQPQQQQQPMPPPQRSVTMPHSQQGSMDPFGPPRTQGVRHVSNESVDFVGMGAGGRHSPDAFPGLSARYMR
ncbi:Protein gts1 [Vermiconidia calcicola]|uniref:Protein gts1 n=1 Tax=Vermiconidia calcicola TaxID=1690605 RepID=A0ACC3MPZ1_9PEZI|nr:Protein gts1 [Vermiconidia calcicola]